ncbi:MAG: hypothetical protein GWM89_02195 [Candidatus Dadabacteria bacterium]|nr:nucleotidyltransferase family protein [Candidatus Dadabacteria bacterium]NIX14704.1 hypothetical protein [Candidatus Dadabacteria bacterium]NIY21240.1 hypothetical protein [Candidatus Dadabacteria bacterium]
MNYSKADIYNSLADEQKLIIILCKLNPGTGGLSFVESAQLNSLDWSYILNFAAINGISSLIYSNITKHGNGHFSDTVINSLKAASLENSKKNLFLTSVLLEIIKELNELGIEAVPYKGPVLSKLLYDDITVREFLDLDIIVHKKHIKRVKEYLISKNYKSQFDLTDREQNYYLNSKYYYINFTRNDSRAAIDLHWALSAPNYSFSKPLDYFCANLDKIEIDNTSIAVLKTEDLFLQLCIHGAKHNFSRFNWITDLVNLSEANTGMDYDYLSGEARRLGCVNILNYTGSLINSLFNLSLPLKNCKQFTQNGCLIAEKIFNSNSRGLSDTSLFPHIFDSRRDRLRFYINNYVYPTPIEFSIIKLNGSLFFLYYLIRVIRMFFRGFKSLVNPGVH